MCLVPIKLLTPIQNLFKLKKTRYEDVARVTAATCWLWSVQPTDVASSVCKSWLLTLAQRSAEISTNTPTVMEICWC